jgi:hypothetical protein
MVPVSSHDRMPSSNHRSVPSTVQSVAYDRPILVSPALRPSSPDQPGQVPSKLATVSSGPRWVRRPASTWWLYCQTASATISGASSGMRVKTSSPIRWLLMKPWPLVRVLLVRPHQRPAVPGERVATSASSACCSGHPAALADSRRSPLATR